MSNKNESEFDPTDTSDHLKNGPERERHLPTMPDPSRDNRETGQHMPTMPDPLNDPERGQQLPAGPHPTPAKKPLQIDDPLLGRDTDITDDGLEQIA